MDEFINLTPHAIAICDPETSEVVATLPPQPDPARAEMLREPHGTVFVGGTLIPVTRNRLGPPSPLPAPQPGRCRGRRSGSMSGSKPW
jgi:hypothetical protein